MRDEISFKLVSISGLVKFEITNYVNVNNQLFGGVQDAKFYCSKFSPAHQSSSSPSPSNATLDHNPPQSMDDVPSNTSQWLPTDILFCLWNARSIVNKLPYFVSFVYSSTYNIIAITETRLSDFIYDNEILSYNIP